MKRVISLLLVAMLVLSCLPVSGWAVEATDTTVMVESTNAAAGATVQVNLLLKNNPGIAGARITVSYHDQLELIEATSGEALYELDYTKPGKYTSPCVFTWDSESGEASQNGTMLTLTFRVAENAVSNSRLNVDVRYRYGDIYNADLEDLTVNMESGYITVLDYMPGDVNGDGVVNGKDVTLVRRYSASGYDVTINEPAADVNADGLINGKDVTMIRRYVAGGYDVELLPSTNWCAHSLKEIKAQAPTCAKEGNNAYWSCDLCGKLYADSEAVHQIVLEDTVREKTEHTVVIDPAVAPTPTTEGLTEGSHCSVCNEVFVAQEVLPPTVVETHEIVYDIANGDPYLEKLLKNGKIENPNQNYYEEGKSYTLKPISVPGYRFVGWHDLAENGEIVKKIDASDTDDRQLYAYWSKIEYKVQYKSSLFVERAEDVYTVDTGLVLPTPKLSNYSFTGWADEEGQLYSETMIPVGTVGNIVLEANWTSERNKTWTKTKLDEPIQYKEGNTLFFVYEIGEIQNVPLYTIKDFGYIAEGGIEKSEETTFSMVISEGTAEQIAETVERATTSSSNWTLSSGWSDSTSISQEWLNEKGYEESEILERATNEESNWNISTGTNGSTDTSVGTSNEKGWSNETKISSSSSSSSSTTNSSSMNAGLESTIGAEGFGVKAEISASLEVEESSSTTNSNSTSKGVEMGGSKSGTAMNTQNSTTSSGWSNSSSYGGSKSSSETETTSTSISEVVTEKYGYGTNYTSEYTSGESQGLEYSNKGAEEWSSSVTYNVEKAEEVTRTWTTEQAKAGYHRWIMAGTAHVFAVVGYDMETQSYFVYTYTVMDDETYEFEDYSYTTAKYNDHENGVISFEIPYEVAEYVADQTAYTQGLKVDQTTGVITGYNGTDNCVVIPEYMNVGGGDVVKITGLKEGVFKNNTNISAVVLSDFITEIPKDCFQGCTNLEGIVGGAIKTIGENAFAGTSVVDCVVRSQVTAVGENAFEGVDCVYFNCANAQVLKAAESCGAKKICIDLAYLKDIAEANNIELSIPEGTQYFEIDGAGKAVSGMTIDSNANETIFTKIDLVGTTMVPLRASSEKVVFNQSSVSADTIAMVLSAEHTDLYLQSTVKINSENKNAIVCKGVTLKELNENVDGRLQVDSKLLYVDCVENEDLIVGGTIEQISKTTYQNMLNPYAVYFDGNGGIVEQETKIVYLDQKYGTLPIPKKEHYAFVGWYTQAMGGELITEDTIVSRKVNHTLYARWEAVTATLMFNANGGTVSESQMEVYIGKAVGTLPVPSRTHYNFSGWFTAMQGGTKVTAETVLNDTAPVTLYAQWTAVPYKVSWKTGDGYTISVVRASSPNAGAFTGALDNGDAVYYGDVLSISYAASTGYTLKSSGSTSVAVEGNVTSSTIYATAKLNSYTYNIEYKSVNGTALGTDTVTYQYGTTNTITAPAKAGYTTPSRQIVKWDSTTAKTITFVYGIESVATTQSVASGTWWYYNGAPRITYATSIQYRNRTATSVEVLVSWTNTIVKNHYFGYAQYFTVSSLGGVSLAETRIATTSTFSSSSTSARSQTVSTGWVTVSLNTTNQKTVSINGTWRDGAGNNGSWSGSFKVPAF